MSTDHRLMGVALALAERGRGRTAPNPNVGCVIVRDGRIIGRGWTQPGGRPHAEAMALAEAGEAARGATLYTTLEPCTHVSERGPACSALIVASDVARVVSGLRDPDVRTDGAGYARLADAGISVTTDVRAADAARTIAGYLTRRRLGRPHATLKLALSIDGCIAMARGQSRWITGPEARAHGHLERARADVILVGRGTMDADAPSLDVRLPGLEDRSPARAVLTHGPAPTGWLAVDSPAAIADLPGDHLLIEGGARAASAFLAADLVDRLLIYRAPIVIGGRAALTDIGLTDLQDAHGRWALHDSRQLGIDRLDVYEHARGS